MVNSIISYAFVDCSSLKKIELPESLIEIGIYTFSENLSIPKSVRNYTF